MTDKKSKPTAKLPKDLKKKKDLNKIEMARAVGGLILPGELSKHAVSEGTKS